MKGDKKRDVICRSVFKNGESTTSKDRFTEKWIEMINQIERRKKYGNF